MNRNILLRVKDFVVAAESKKGKSKSLQKNQPISECNAAVTTVFWYSTSRTSYTIVRPLMNCLRCTLTSSCVLSGLPVYPDFSNLKMIHSRNRIRKQIVPTMKFFFNPKAENALLQFSEFYNR